MSGLNVKEIVASVDVDIGGYTEKRTMPFEWPFARKVDILQLVKLQNIVFSFG
jgi:hypothetical protein